MILLCLFVLQTIYGCNITWHFIKISTIFIPVMILQIIKAKNITAGCHKYIPKKSRY